MKLYKVKSKLTKVVKWGVTYNDPTGKQIRQIVASTKDDAEAIMAKMRSEMELGEYYDRRTVVQITVPDLITRYKEFFKTKDSYATECIHLKAVEAFFGKELISTITEEDVKKFVNARLAIPKRYSDPVNPEPRSNATINRELWALKRLLYKAVDWKLLRENPAHKIEPLEESKTHVSYLTATQADAILAAAAKSTRSPHLYPIILTALETGMRREEIMSLKYSSIDWSKKSIHLTSTKNSKDRYVPISDLLVATLKAQPRRLGSDYVFPNEDGKAMNDVRTGFEVARGKAGIPDSFRFHDLRHTFVTHALDNNMPLNVVADIVGHTLVAMLSKYGHILAGRKHEVVNSMPWGRKVAK